jgi:hypothetical protein
MSTPGLDDDHFGRGGTDPGDLIQVGHRCGDRGVLGLGLGVEVGDVGAALIDAGEDRGQQEAVVVGEGPHEGPLGLMGVTGPTS